VSELLIGDPAHTLVNKHASHVWSKVRISSSLLLSVVRPPLPPSYFMLFPLSSS
jgi:hypothetical protein